MSLKEFSEWSKIMEDLLSGQPVADNPTAGVPPVNDRDSSALKVAMDQLYKVLGINMPLWKMAMDSLNKQHGEAIKNAHLATEKRQTRPGAVGGGENGSDAPFQGGAQ